MPWKCKKERAKKADWAFVFDVEGGKPSRANILCLVFFRGRQLHFSFKTQKFVVDDHGKIT